MLHASAANSSDDWRRSMIVAYNGKDNEPILEDIIPNYSKIEVMEDHDILKHGIVVHGKDRQDFLSAEKNASSFEQEIK